MRFQEERILEWYSAGGEAETVADRWGGRVRRLGGAGAGALGLGGGSINVSAVRETDAGLYRCRVSFPNRSPPARNNGTFYYLEVDGECAPSPLPPYPPPRGVTLSLSGVCPQAGT